MATGGVVCPSGDTIGTDDLEYDEPPALAFYCPECARREFGTMGV
jgi:hypothetical protein